MDTIQTIVLAIVQGFTELLPISSTGHMLLVSDYLFGVKPDLLLLIVLQFGTTLAIIFGFKEYIFVKPFSKEKFRLYLYICLATIPAVAFALSMCDFVEQVLYSRTVIAISLFAWGIAMILIENVNLPKPKTLKMGKLSLFQVIAVGLAQAVAIIPGTSRSGSTTVVGVLTGVEKYTALRFSFLLGIPVLLGSFLYELWDYRDNLAQVFTLDHLLGIVIAGVVGYLSIRLLKYFSKSKFLTFFGIYRIILAILIVVTLIR